jgi:hypothetical protein
MTPFARSLDSRLEHGLAAGSVHRYQLRAHRRGAACCAAHRSRNIMELEVEKDVVAESTKRLHHLRPGRRKKLASHFVKTASIAEELYDA